MLKLSIYSSELLLASLTMLYLCGFGETLECYMCQTAIDGPGCGDKNGFDTSMPASSQLTGSDDADLNLPGTECGMCTKAKVQTDNGEYVVRSCLPVVSGSSDCASWEYMGYKGEMCTCSGNLCNYSIQQRASLSLLLLSAIFVLITMFHARY